MVCKQCKLKAQIGSDHFFETPIRNDWKDFNNITNGNQAN